MARTRSEKQYASVGWTVEDLNNVKPQWSKEQCEDWLKCHRRAIEERMIEAGWEILEEMISEEEDDDEDLRD